MKIHQRGPRGEMCPFTGGPALLVTPLPGGNEVCFHVIILVFFISSCCCVSQCVSVCVHASLRAPDSGVHLCAALAVISCAHTVLYRV